MKNSSSSTLAVKKAARPKKKKSSSSSAKAMSPTRKRKPDEEGDGAVYVGTINGDDGRPATRQRRQELEMREQERNKVEVKQELRMPRLEEGETLCPLCGKMNYIEWGCKTVICYRDLSHLNGEYAYYCGYCRMLSPDGDLSKCKCPFAYNRSDRLRVLANPELCLVNLSNDDDGPVIPDEDEDNTSRTSTDSSSVSEKIGDGKDSDAIDSEYFTNISSEAAMDQKDDVQDVVLTADLSDRTIKIKQDPEAVPSTAVEEETVSDDKIPPQEVMSSTAIPVAVTVKVKTEGVNDSAAFHEETDTEDSASSNGEEEEEEDVAALIYQESQLRKREAAAEEEEGEPREAAPKKRRKVSSARKASKGKRKSPEDEEESAATAKVEIDLSDVPLQPPIPKRGIIKEGASRYMGVSLIQRNNKWKAQISIEGKFCHIGSYENEKEAAVDYARTVFKYKGQGALDRARGDSKGKRKKQYRKECSAEGCTNQAKAGGVCRRHGAKAPRYECSADGCTNQAQKGGVCYRHGANYKKKECSVDECTNKAQEGGVCIRHGAKVTRKRCSEEGCTKHVQNGGVCVRHGAKTKRCSSEGCTNYAIQGRVCVKHGAKVKLCSSEGCTRQARRGGVCTRHGAKK